MSYIRENKVDDEFNRHSCIYKQFKVHNTRRTSTPQPLVRPKHIRRNILCDPITPPGLSSRCSSEGEEVDTAYVSYVQWRHYLVVPNSARKFKVRYAGCCNINVPFRGSDTIISGNINMLPSSKTISKQKATKTAKSKRSKDAKVEELLNSRIVEVANNNLEDYIENLEKRNKRIVQAVVPLIKKSLKRFFIGEAKKSKPTKVFNGFNGLKKEKKEDKLLLIDYYNNECVEIEE